MAPPSEFAPIPSRVRAGAKEKHGVTIFDFEQRLLAHIDRQVATATEDELFAGGYLRGHISLAVAHCESEGLNQIEAVQQAVEASLLQASQAGELSEADEVLVRHMWLQLQNAAG